LKIPSGVQAGIKLVHPFTIEANLTTELILDFDAAKSVHKAGNSGPYILKPTIKVIGTPHAVISGTVTDDQTEPEPQALEKTRVTAQTYDGGAEDEKDKVVVHSITTTDGDGYYAMHLPLGDYCIVASPNETAPGEAYGPGCREMLNVLADTVYDFENFVFPQVQAVNITKVIQTDGDDVTVTLSFRQTGSDFGCAICTDIEVWSDTVLAGPDPYTHTVGLPVGTYDVVSFTDCEETVETGVPAYTDTTLGTWVFSSPCP
jgi:hypothetical protein